MFNGKYIKYGNVTSCNSQCNNFLLKFIILLPIILQRMLLIISKLKYLNPKLI